jgi:signal transduction histidine kinase
LTPDEQRRLISSVDATEDLEQRLIAAEDQAALDLELTQLGMAIQVINHEFDATVKSVRQNLQRLKAWADLNTGLQELYKNIRASFDHLDGYLTLFTPLNRRLYRNKIEMTGAEICKFLEDLFRERLERHGVTLKQTLAFRKMKVTGYPSSFYPVFVNLVDNSLFWLNQRNGLREIKLDADGNAFVISDSGPGIVTRDQERVFEFGFTRKPGGRGMGLYVSRRTLEKEGYTLILMPFEDGQGATFRIEPKVSNQGEKDSDN